MSERPAAARTTWAVIKRTVIAFYDNQMTHHAAALTYYGLLSLFPALLLAVSLLGLLGQYPETYDAIINYIREVSPDATIDTFDSALRTALESKGSAAIAFVVGLLVALYGTTGVLEAARRALNVAFEVENGRSFLQRKATDAVSSIVLMVLVLITLVLMFVGGGLAAAIFDLIGLGSTAETVWKVVRWPAALATAMLVFSFVYYVTPDVEQRSFRWVTPGAIVGVLLWLLASVAFSEYISSVADVGAIYGTFAGAIVLVAWMWLTNVALLFGAELNAEIERQKEFGEGVPEHHTLSRPSRRG